MGLKDRGRIDFSRIFLRVQEEMLAHLAVGEVFEHPNSCGAATEQQWIGLFNQYLPQRYRASSAFIVDADGRRSRQIDVAIYDNFYSPLLFPHDSGLHVAAESVYAVFEVKQALTPELLRDAGRKAGSVRRLRRTSVPVPFAGGCYPAKEPPQILAGILAIRAAWSDSFHWKLPAALRQMSAEERLDLGCALAAGAFEFVAAEPPGLGKVRLSTAKESLIFFVLRLLERLRAMGTAPAADLMDYGRSLESFSTRDLEF